MTHMMDLEILMLIWILLMILMIDDKSCLHLLLCEDGAGYCCINICDHTDHDGVLIQCICNHEIFDDKHY